MLSFTTSSIGTTDPGTETAHYSTIAAWEDATSIDLMAADRQETGKIRNEELAGGISVTGATTDATRFRHLTAYDGEGFADLADANTVLRYGITGARVLCTTNIAIVEVTTEPYFRMSNLQFNNTGSGGAARGLNIVGDDATDTGHLIDGCIVMTIASAECVRRGVTHSSAVFTVRNSVLIQDGIANEAFWCDKSGTINLFNVTMVSPSNRSNSASAIIIVRTPATFTMKNCAVFGFANAVSDPGVTFAATTCATDDATAPTGFTASLTYADQYEEPSSASSLQDFRLKTGADLIDAGTDISGDGVTTDIFGTARSTYDIGAHEVPEAGGGAATGDATQTIAPIEQSATGIVGGVGTATQTIAMFRQASVATLTVPGQAAQVVPVIEQAASGEHVNTAEGAAAQTLPVIEQAGDATLTLSGDAAQVVPVIEQAGDATHATAPVGDGAQTLAALTQIGAGEQSQPATGDGAQILAAITQAAAAEQIMAGAAAQTLEAVTQAGGGLEIAVGVAAQVLAAIAQAATAEQEMAGAGEQTLAAVEQSGDGTQSIAASGSGLQTLAALIQQAQALVTADAIVPDAPGMEWTLTGARPHWTLTQARLHWTLTRKQLH